MKRVLALLLAAALFFCFTACQKEEEEPEVVGGSTVRRPVESGELQFQFPEEGALIATIKTSRGDIRAVLYPRYAPLAAENFQGLAEAGYYTGTEFHRVVKDFLVQGGDATGTGLGGASIWGTPFPIEITDKLHCYTGALCMATADGDPNSNASQFFILQTPQDGIDEAAAARLRQAGLREEVVQAYQAAGGAPYLDNTCTVFGQVYAGMDVVDAIGGLATDETGRPKSPVSIESVSFSAYVPAPSTAAPPAGAYNPGGEASPGADVSAGSEQPDSAFLPPSQSQASLPPSAE